MKKKIRLIIVMVALCVSVILGVKYYQTNISEPKNNKKTDIVLENAQVKEKEEKTVDPSNSEIKHEEKQEDKKAVVENKKSIKSEDEHNSKNGSSTSSKQQSSNTLIKQTSKKETDSKQAGSKETNNKEVQQIKNVLIKDEVSGKVIGNIYCNLDNRSAADVTIDALNKMGIRYKAVGSGETIYFSSINGIKERSQGPLSGWCYYVNGSKPSVGAGLYKLKNGDKVQWVFKKDGVN